MHEYAIATAGASLHPTVSFTTCCRAGACSRRKFSILKYLYLYSVFLFPVKILPHRPVNAGGQQDIPKLIGVQAVDGGIFQLRVGKNALGI